MTKQTPIEALRRAVDWGCASNHKDCKLPICTDARVALEGLERLDAELHDSAQNVLSLSASLGTKIERVSELEAEAERLRASLEHIAICDYALPCEHHQLALVDPREQASAALVGTQPNA